MKFLIFTTSLLVWTGLLAGIAVSASTGLVTATVTTQNLSVRVEDATVAYGTVAESGTANTEGSDQQSAGNDGNVTEDFDIQGTDSASWTLENTIGSDNYTHGGSTTGAAPYDLIQQATTIAMVKSVSAGSTQTFDLQIATPSTDTTGGVQQNVNVTVTASAT